MVLWACLPPRGYLRVSSVPPEECGIEWSVPHLPGSPLVGPAQPPLHLPHQGEGLIPQRARTGPPCPSRRLPLRRRRRAALPPCRGHPRRLRSWRCGGWLVLGSRGLGGDKFSGVGVDVVEVGVVGVVMVGVVRQNLLDAGGNAPHGLHVRLRRRPASRPPPFDLPSPLGSHAPSCLSLGAHGALALALGPPSGPHVSFPLPVPWVPPPVTHALARTAGARARPVPLP